MMKRLNAPHYITTIAFLIACFGLTPAFGEEAPVSGSDEDAGSVDKPAQPEVDTDTTEAKAEPSDEEAAETSDQTDESASQDTDATDPVAGFDCESAPWVLGEAGRSGGATVTFNPNWQTLIKKIAGCKAHMIKHARCLRLQGHYDSHVFSTDIVHVFGTQQVAQMVRARSRAQTVAAHLESLGFPEALVTTRQPPPESSFRGVLVDYEEDCFGAKQSIEPEPTPEPVVEVVTVVEEVELSPEPTPTPIKKLTRDLWTQLDAGALYLDDRDGVIGLQTALHLGWTHRGLYIKVLGTMSGTNEELHRAGYGVQAGFGVHTPWTDLGVIAGIRNNARGLSDPVGDQIQFVGVDAQQCVWRHSSFALCVREAFAPLTRMQRKLDLDNGALVRINSVTTQPMQFELAASIRYYFGEAQ